MSLVARDPTPDLHPDTLSAMSALMVAQAQESIYQKSSIGKHGRPPVSSLGSLVPYSVSVSTDEKIIVVQ